MFTKIINLTLFWALLCCCALAALTAEAASLPNAQNDHANLVKRNNDKGESRGIQWKLAIEEDGPIMEFNGTLQQVEKQIQAIKPDFKFTPIPATDNNNNNTVSHNQLNKHWRCLDFNHDTAVAGKVQDGINYLRGLGDAVCGDQGGSDGTNCGQISCSWNSAIKWCNIGASYYEAKCSSFADYAQDVLDHCRSPTNDFDVHGQEGDTTAEHNFFVLVEAAHC